MDLKTLFTKQKMMRTVLLALIPIALLAVFLYGWRWVLMGLLVGLAAVISEYLVMRSINKEKAKVSEAVFVSAALFTLTLPPMTPMWVAVVGIVFGGVFGKGVFGGFGRNIFNPALVGRCFIYVAFPAHMTMTWPQPFLSLPGGFAAYSTAVDAISAATPIITYNASGALPNYLHLFLGNVAGSLGESSALLILLSGLFLVYKKVASWQLMVSTIVSGTALSALFHYAGVTQATGMAAAPPLFMLLSGGFLFGSIFMVTDPISAPKTKQAQWVAGTLVGLITVIIRTFSLFTEGMMFAILIVNAFTPLLELQIKRHQDRKKLQKKEAAA
ncbi:MAG: RnfABCDGE type electron transport complex subunit D [Clostridiales bacterium]|nr:RnfABCDGE type electron transport complex subunit D [Clostridiales bacterium]